MKTDTPRLEHLLEAVQDQAFSWLVGSHMHGTAGPDSDEDHLTVYWDRDDHRRVFKLHPDVLECSEPDHKVYSLAKFCELLAKGNPNVIEVLEHQTIDNANRMSPEVGQLLFVDLQPYLHHQGYARAIVGHVMSAIKEPEYKRTPKRIAHALRLGRMGVARFDGRWSPDLTTDELQYVREVKFGRVSLDVAAEDAREAALWLEGHMDRIITNIPLRLKINEWFEENA